MKLLGHALIARRAYPEGDPELTMLGSVLPEIMYYVSTNPFSHDQIHEGGLDIYKYLLNVKPEWKDLGIGMITHSVKYGADKYNDYEHLSSLGFSERDFRILRTRLMNYLEIDEETAKVRAHNIVELALEVNIIKNYQEFLREFKAMLNSHETQKEAADIISSCFSVNKIRSEKAISELFEKASSDCFNDAMGLAILWSRLSKNFDPEPDIENLSHLLTELATNFNGKDNLYIEDCVSWVRNNLQALL